MKVRELWQLGRRVWAQRRGGGMDSAVLPLPAPASWWWRGVILYVTWLVPIISFGGAWEASPLQPEWQTGNWEHYLGLWLDGEISVYFAPFLLYGMVSVLVLMWVPERVATWRSVRWGIYCGTWMAGHYMLIFLVTTPFTLVWAV
ncbi:MAG TPA: hypothetical protein VLL52_16435, partial [Anaerolineae bacterium]|nr:hypothetical protein [Anaerolineae bacterium]